MSCAWRVRVHCHVPLTWDPTDSLFAKSPEKLNTCPQWRALSFFHLTKLPLEETFSLFLFVFSFLFFFFLFMELSSFFSPFLFFIFFCIIYFGCCWFFILNFIYLLVLGTEISSQSSLFFFRCYKQQCCMWVLISIYLFIFFFVWSTFLRINRD